MPNVLTLCVLDYHISTVSHISSINRLGLDCQMSLFLRVSVFNLLVIRASHIPCINLMVVTSLVVCINPLDVRVTRVSCINTNYNIIFYYLLTGRY